MAALSTLHSSHSPLYQAYLAIRRLEPPEGADCGEIGETLRHKPPGRQTCSGGRIEGIGQADFAVTAAGGPRGGGPTPRARATRGSAGGWGPRRVLRGLPPPLG